MKRIKSACICQTLHFQLKDGVGRDYAIRMVQEEVEHYKKTLERSHTKYKIVDEQPQPDGSILVRVIKQYNMCDVGDYLN